MNLSHVLASSSVLGSQNDNDKHQNDGKNSGPEHGHVNRKQVSLLASLHGARVAAQQLLVDGLRVLVLEHVLFAQRSQACVNRFNALAQIHLQARNASNRHKSSLTPCREFLRGAPHTSGRGEFLAVYTRVLSTRRILRSTMGPSGNSRKN